MLHTGSLKKTKNKEEVLIFLKVLSLADVIQTTSAWTDSARAHVQKSAVLISRVRGQSHKKLHKRQSSLSYFAQRHTLKYQQTSEIYCLKLLSVVHFKH